MSAVQAARKPPAVATDAAAVVDPLIQRFCETLWPTGAI